MGDPLDITKMDDVKVVGGVAFPRKSALHTPTPDAFTATIQPADSYYTTRQFAQKMGMSDKLVHRWCQQWYGHLPPTRQGKSMGYRIHPYMTGVARGWLQTKDPWVRDAILQAMRKESRDWVVVVGKSATTHYTAMEAVEAVRKVVSTPRNRSTIATVLYVGDE